MVYALIDVLLNPHYRELSCIGGNYARVWVFTGSETERLIFRRQVQERNLYFPKRRQLCDPSLSSTKKYRGPERDITLLNATLTYKERPLLMQTVSQDCQPEICG